MAAPAAASPNERRVSAISTSLMTIACAFDYARAAFVYERLMDFAR
jgi:hypothetical protein